MSEIKTVTNAHKVYPSKNNFTEFSNKNYYNNMNV